MLAPVVRLLRAQLDWEAVVTGYGHGMNGFRERGIHCEAIERITDGDLRLFEKHKPDLIVSSATSLPAFDMSEKWLWVNARKAGVPSIAFLDQWQNYSIRFSGLTEDERHAYLPDFINCLDGRGRTEMIAEDFEEAKLIQFGHPYLAEVEKMYEALEPEKIRKKLEAEIGELDRGKTVLFVSEAIREYFGSSRSYDQYQVLEYFLQNVRRSAPEANVAIKLHPKDCIETYRQTTAKYVDLKIRFIQNELTSLECLHLTGPVFGMTSMMLIEAFVLGKAVVSLQPGLVAEDPLVLSRHGIVPVIKDNSEFDIFDFSPGCLEHFNISFDQKAFLNFIREIVKAGYES